MKTLLPALALSVCLACQGPSAVDEGPGPEAVVVALQHADAVETAAVLEGLAASATAGSGGYEVSILADEASNALLLRGPEPALEELRALVAALDTDRAAGS